MGLFERLQKPFLTVETGEAYQPIRLSYFLYQKEKLIDLLNQLKCCEKLPSGLSWHWFWRNECDDLHFESLESFKKNPDNPVRLGTLSIREDILYINLPSFKRACLAVPFFHKTIPLSITKVNKADFINKVFGLDERLPHGFAELFKEEELEKIVSQRIQEFEETQEKVAYANTIEEAFNILSEFNHSESKKRLPYAERYVFQETDAEDADVIFLCFYIFLRGRELVAIHRWFGETGYSISDAAEETIEKVFGNMNIDLLE